MKDSSSFQRSTGRTSRPKLRARRSLSQNFLIDGAVADRIAAALPVKPTDCVYEIGAGKGFLTERLATLVGTGRVLALEKDRRLVGMLRQKFQPGGPVEVYWADILNLPPDAEPPDPCWLYGNLPFGIGHAILEWAFARRSRFGGAVFTLQREVVQRLLAGPGERGRAASSIWFQARARGRALFDIPPGAFHPPPRVTSTVMSIEFVPTTPGIEHAPGIEYVVRCAFAQKRKIMANNLGAIPGLTAAGWQRIRDLCPDLLEKRAEQLHADDFARLAQLLHRPGQVFPDR
ncbi:MAG: 16S rRNA (adenine(1518)-N(6)/adenine(1519)-N(6))-dimethyltransferase RsmA [Candidatus Zixiibacteriota bacterium]